MTNSAQWQFAEGRVTFLPPRGAQLDTGAAAAHLPEEFLSFVRQKSRNWIGVCQLYLKVAFIPNYKSFDMQALTGWCHNTGLLWFYYPHTPNGYERTGLLPAFSFLELCMRVVNYNHYL